MLPNQQRNGVPCTQEICTQRPGSQELHVRNVIYTKHMNGLKVKPVLDQVIRGCAPLLIMLYRIDSNFVIKVADFGLSESVYTKTCFMETGGSCVKLPVKWMSLESLTDGVFTEKADVVCLGVV